jgi:hypothetical protein
MVGFDGRAELGAEGETNKMPVNQMQRLRRAGLLAAASLLLALAVQVGLTTAATGSSGDSGQGRVRIEIRGETLYGGLFTVSGAISDRGRFIDTGGAVTIRRLIGAKGTIWLTIGLLDGKPVRCQCNWRVIKGTKAYAGLRGRGHEEGMYAGPNAPTTHVTMYGTVSQ